MSEKRVALIKERLIQAFHPEVLEVIDESHLHQGHAGAATGRGHFRLEIKCSELSLLPRVKAHQKIYHTLGSLMESDIHALSICILES